jgi:hypothetical protein
MDPIHPLIIRYMNLAHSIADRLPDYIDTYFGPEEWILPVAIRESDSITSLKDKGEALLEEILAVDRLEPQRRTFLEAQLQAMKMTIRILEGEEIPLEEKFACLFGIKPQRFPEAALLEIHNQLDGLLPGGGNLRERILAFEEQIIIPGDKLGVVFENIIQDLQRWTLELYELPANECYQLEFVTDKPWTGYSIYKGDGLSKIEVNKDMPFSLLDAIDFLAHEIYPGHHTETSTKETELIFGQGREELYIILMLSPYCILAEGIAVHALEIALPQDRYIDWLNSKLLPLANLTHLDARQLIDIQDTYRRLRPVSSNAFFMYWVDGEEPERVKEYYREYSLNPEPYVEKFVEKWLPNPIYSLFTFSYRYGYDLLEQLFARTGDPIHWFGELLRRTYLPCEIETIGDG